MGFKTDWINEPYIFVGKSDVGSSLSWHGLKKKRSKRVQIEKEREMDYIPVEVYFLSLPLAAAFPRFP